ncbi:MAG: DinB family protein [Candidatus Thorarchaeota archaeon]
MLNKFLSKAIERHLDETYPLLMQLDDRLLYSEPVPGGRVLGEVVFHMLRSIEFYLRGIIEGKWEPAPYAFDEFVSAESFHKLVQNLFGKARTYLSLLYSSDLSRAIDSFNRPATVGEILLEMLEHSIHHRGQLTVYLRYLGVEPEKIEYII